MFIVQASQIILFLQRQMFLAHLVAITAAGCLDNKNMIRKGAQQMECYLCIAYTLSVTSRLGVGGNGDGSPGSLLQEELAESVEVQH